MLASNAGKLTTHLRSFQHPRIADGCDFTVSKEAFVGRRYRSFKRHTQRSMQQPRLSVQHDLQERTALGSPSGGEKAFSFRRPAYGCQTCQFWYCHLAFFVVGELKNANVTVAGFAPAERNMCPTWRQVPEAVDRVDVDAHELALFACQRIEGRENQMIAFGFDENARMAQHGNRGTTKIRIPSGAWKPPLPRHPGRTWVAIHFSDEFRGSARNTNSHQPARSRELIALLIPSQVENPTSIRTELWISFFF